MIFSNYINYMTHVSLSLMGIELLHRHRLFWHALKGFNVNDKEGGNNFYCGGSTPFACALPKDVTIENYKPVMVLLVLSQDAHSPSTVSLHFKHCQPSDDAPCFAKDYRFKVITYIRVSNPIYSILPLYNHNIKLKIIPRSHQNLLYFKKNPKEILPIS